MQLGYAELWKISQNKKKEEEKKKERIEEVLERSPLFNKPLYVAKKMEWKEEDELGNEPPQVEWKVSSTKNIFHKSNLFETNANQIIGNIGPRFDTKGNILKYSIVGRPEPFIKLHRPKGSYGTLLTQKHNLIRAPTLSSQDEFGNLSITEENNSGNETVIKDGKKISIRRNSIAKKPLAITKNEVLEKLKEIETTRDEFKAIERTTFLQLPKIVQQSYSKEERILKSFDRMESQWNQWMRFQAKKLNRHLEDSLYAQGEGYKLKKEGIESLDVLKPEVEKINIRIWYNHLRDYEPKRKRAEKIVI